ncbi:presqualene diphosphate synthase HpnD [Entomobacter blattae]|uniref:presqualene diphosphate synthase HpnD n=1 Tax=Entomobacter blattae TaxID=2762277 RepID=UPI0038D07F71
MLLDRAKTRNTGNGVCTPEDVRAVAEIVKQAGTSFAKGMQSLSLTRRIGMYALYAFCRVVDDIADEDGPEEEKIEALQAWKKRISALFSGQTGDSLDRVLLFAIRRYGLAQQDFNDVIDGMEMDAQTAIIAPDEATLDLYCDRVASAVGRLSVRIFGEPSPLGSKVAYHLGRALQITNILRDLGEDAQRGRLYLPAELLARYGIPKDPYEALYHENLSDVCRIMALRAQDHFREAYKVMAQCDKKAMRPARLMAFAYEALLKAQKKKGWNNTGKSVSLAPWQKLGIAVKSLLA